MLAIAQKGTCNRSLVPSGDQTGRESPTDVPTFRRLVSDFVRSRMWTVQGYSSLARTNAMLRPSGDHLGNSSVYSPEPGFAKPLLMSRVTLEPSAFIMKMVPSGPPPE